MSTPEGQQALALIQRYCSAFNRGDWQGMLELLSSGVAHDVNQGQRQIGRESFAVFLQRMARCHLEVLTDIRILVSDDGKHAAAEYAVSGQYISSQEGLPPARGQRYRRPGGTFFEIDHGEVCRVSDYFNLADWIAQLSRDD